ncbi:MAG: ATP synthase subunit I [Janthinobacterium lividum]
MKSHMPDSRPGARGSAAAPRHPSDDWEIDPEEEEFVPLSRTEAQQLFGPNVSRPSRVTPKRVVAAQLGLTLCSMLAWWLLSSRPGIAALSALVGGMICWIPSALFAWRMRRPVSGDTLGGWVIGEGIKIGMTIAMFTAVAVWFANVHWLAMLLTYIIALKTYWIALAWR